MLFYLLLIETAEGRSKFECLYEKYYKLMLYLANQILHDDYAAEDITHEAFLVIIDYIDKIEEVESTRTKNFISIIVKNRAKDLYRKKNRVEILPMESIQNLPDTEYNDDCTRLKNIIMMLPEKLRDVAELKFFYCYSNKEISAFLKIKEDLVRKRLERAKKVIAEQYFSKGDEK